MIIILFHKIGRNMGKRLLIIKPSYYVKKQTKNKQSKEKSLIGLTLPYLAALVPSGWDIKLLDEQMEDINFDEKFDVVALTTWTINSLRAYDIAAEYRKRKIPILMGGPHTFFYRDEAKEHCDAIGIGEGEKIFPQMLNDFENNNLQKEYIADQEETIKNLPFPKYELLNPKYHGLIKTYAIQASRGCPFTCDFCSERYLLGKKYRYRSVEDVVNEIKHSGAKNIFFADSNFAGKIEHTMELMEALIPLKIRWSTLWSAYLCNNEDFLNLAKKSGVLHVNMGIESIDKATLGDMNKKVNKVDKYKEMILNLRKRGISFSLNFIFGWDTESKDIFKTTLDFLKENKVHAAYFNILTPHRGTHLYERLKEEGRITDDYNIGRWPGMFCHIIPKYCTAQELMDSVQSMYNQFYNFPSMLSRLPFPLSKSSMASWIINISQRTMTKKSDSMDNFDAF